MALEYCLFFSLAHRQFPLHLTCLGQIGCFRRWMLFVIKEHCSWHPKFYGHFNKNERCKPSPLDLMTRIQLGNKCNTSHPFLVEKIKMHIMA